MHRLRTSFILGYHGCDQVTADRLLSGEPIKKSNNDYDWLGPGIYFWEANPYRALSFAEEAKRRGIAKITKPAVVGAVIEMGFCLDLATQAGIEQVKKAYDALEQLSVAAKVELPKNETGSDYLQRKLDCAVIRQLHEIREQQKQDPIDSVRGIFLEGGRIYPGAGFRDKTHSQVCVCNTEQVKGVFRVKPGELL